MLFCEGVLLARYAVILRLRTVRGKRLPVCQGASFGTERSLKISSAIPSHFILLYIFSHGKGKREFQWKFKSGKTIGDANKKIKIENNSSSKNIA